MQQAIILAAVLVLLVLVLVLVLLILILLLVLVLILILVLLVVHWCFLHISVLRACRKDSVSRLSGFILCLEDKAYNKTAYDCCGDSTCGCL